MVLAVLAGVLCIAAALLWRRHVAKAREAHIRSFQFPKGLFSQVTAKYPHLTAQDMELVSRGLRQFFLAYLKGGRQCVAMPSQVVDELWHAFILHTRSYEAFTRQAFGTFLHHTPAVALSSQSRSNIGLRRCWAQACLEENINPRAPARLPLLFGLDAQLGIANGFHYLPDCRGVRRTSGSDSAGSIVHCGADFLDASADSGTTGLSDRDGFDKPGGRDDGPAGEGGGDSSGGDGGSDGGGGGGDSGGDGGGGCGGGGD
jgi:hypothetical protein